MATQSQTLVDLLGRFLFRWVLIVCLWRVRNVRAMNEVKSIGGWICHTGISVLGRAIDTSETRICPTPRVLDRA